MRRVALRMCGIERQVATVCTPPPAWPPSAPPVAQAAPLPSLHVCTAKRAVTHAMNMRADWCCGRCTEEPSRLLPVDDPVSSAGALVYTCMLETCTLQKFVTERCCSRRRLKSRGRILSEKVAEVLELLTQAPVWMGEHASCGSREMRFAGTVLVHVESLCRCQPIQQPADDQCSCSWKLLLSFVQNIPAPQRTGCVHRLGNS